MNDFCSKAWNAARKLTSGVCMLALFALSGCARLEKPAAISDTKTVVVKDDSETERRIEALAQFATGLHHEYNDEATAANDRFLKAAFADLTNEVLVLDV